MSIHSLHLISAPLSPQIKKQQWKRKATFIYIDRFSKVFKSSVKLISRSTLRERALNPYLSRFKAFFRYCVPEVSLILLGSSDLGICAFEKVLCFLPDSMELTK